MATITGTSGNDFLEGTSGADRLFGLAGDDFLWGQAGRDLLDGGPGSDTVYYGGSNSGVRVDLADGFARDGFGSTDRIVSVGLAIGSAHDDTLWGNSNLNTLSGGGGNDRLFGRAGNDTLKGGSGDDLLQGGLGSDTVSYFDDPGAVQVDLAAGRATDGWGGQDTIFSVGTLWGTPFGADTLAGNDSANTLNGVGGANVLTGNGGADTFEMNSWDWWGSTITDFQAGLDLLTVDLHSTPVTGYSAGPLDSSRFTTDFPTGPDWTFVYNPVSGVVGFDIDGTGPSTGVTMVTLANRPDLAADDFLLT